MADHLMEALERLIYVSCHDYCKCGNSPCNLVQAEAALASARLSAAAPDLLEVLAEAQQSNWTVDQEWINRADAAIAKARGTVVNG